MHRILGREEAGLPDRVIGAALGHAPGSTMLGKFARVRDDSLRQIVRKGATSPETRE